MYFDRYDNEISIEEAECRGYWKTEQREKCQKKKEGTSKQSPKKSVFSIRQPKQVEQQVTTTI